MSGWFGPLSGPDGSGERILTTGPHPRARPSSHPPRDQERMRGTPE
ncbi:hypothetical protein GJR88_01379 [Dietzia sp. DQ12-45-1b]|nr:hypothetical protein GJR88_01379 [Dietzia sp. DQ12-45-1b]